MDQKSRVWNFLMVWSFPLLVGILILSFRPFWGLMDDAVNLEIVQGMNKYGFFSVWWKESVADLFGNGRLRFLYPPMVWLLYGPASGNSIITFFLNGAFVIGIFFYLGWAFSFSAKRIFRKQSAEAFPLLFFFLCFAFPWTQYLFLAPSVQEKTVLLFGGILLALVQVWNKKYFLWIGAIVLGVFFALNTKEQIVLFFPILLAAHFDTFRGHKRWWRRISFLFLLILGVAVIWWAGTHGQYKSRYGWDNALLTLKNSKTVWLFLLVAVSAQLANVLNYFRDRDWGLFFHRSSYPLALGFFVLLLLPWGLGHYLNTAALVFFIFCLLILADFLLPRGFSHKKIIPGTFVLSLVSLLFQLVPTFSAAGDLGRLIRSPALASASEIIHIPCEEGSLRIQQYAKWFEGISLAVDVPRGTEEKDVLETSGLWLVSPLRCTNGVDFQSLAKRGLAEFVFSGNFSSGFQLVRIKGQR